MNWRRPTVKFVTGAAFGVVAAIVGTSLSLITGVAAVVAVAVVGLALPRFAFLAGGLLSLGLTWTVLVITTIWQCQATVDFCGNANPWPFAAISLLLAAAGLLLTATTYVASRRRH